MTGSALHSLALKAGRSHFNSPGCRGGICGACPTVYRREGDYKLYFGLACQTVVEPNMYLAQIPFYPANLAPYDIDKIGPLADAVHASTRSFSAAWIATTAPRCAR